MKKPLLLIKMGGSVVTYKDDSVPKLRLDTIKKLAKEIAAIRKGNKYKIILVHGAGSFGHPIVKKYGLHKGMRNTVQKLAYSQTLQNMLRLNGVIVQNLIENSIPAVSLPPHAFTSQNKGRFARFNTNLIKMCVDNDQVPVLFGDAVLDKNLGCSILSGDTIISYLAKKLKAKKVVFLSDVDGVFDSDPRTNTKAKLIPLINNQNFQRVFKSLKTTNSLNRRADVTGEINGKILSIKKDLKGIQVLIFNGLIPENLTRLLRNRNETRSTRLYFK